MLWLRSQLFNILFYINTALFLVFGSWLLLAPRSWAMQGLRAHAATSMLLMRLICGTKVVVRGREHLPDRPFLIAAKHQSAWDTFALIPIFHDPALVMKAELMKIPLYGWFSTKFGMIPIRRETGPSALREMLREAQSRRDDGREILVFPEGTRRLPGAPADYKPGVLMLYDRLNIACVPVALNSGLFWPRNSLLRYPGTIIVEILPPIPPELPRKDFARRLQETVETATERLVDAERARRSAVQDPELSGATPREP
ncbi:MAG: lysophospholipid acyltransferase family protein [Hyphomicrobiaceae bacterium]